MAVPCSPWHGGLFATGLSLPHHTCKDTHTHTCTYPRVQAWQSEVSGDAHTQTPIHTVGNIDFLFGISLH